MSIIGRTQYPGERYSSNNRLGDPAYEGSRGLKRKLHAAIIVAIAAFFISIVAFILLNWPSIALTR